MSEQLPNRQDRTLIARDLAQAPPTAPAGEAREFWLTQSGNHLGSDVWNVSTWPQKEYQHQLPRQNVVHVREVLARPQGEGETVSHCDKCGDGWPTAGGEPMFMVCKKCWLGPEPIAERESQPTSARMSERDAWKWAHENRVQVTEFRNGTVVQLGVTCASGLSPQAAINALRSILGQEQRGNGATSDATQSPISAAASPVGKRGEGRMITPEEEALCDFIARSYIGGNGSVSELHKLIRAVAAARSLLSYISGQQGKHP